ncbi:Murein DD-endopeptidase MepS/Murein LD-carboxypeptidase precursor [compost metagenome]
MGFNRRQAALTSIIGVMILTTACGYGPQTSNEGTQQRTEKQGMSQGEGIIGLSQADQVKPIGNNGDAVIPIVPINQANYVKVKDVADLLKFKMAWKESNRTLQLGDNDAAFELAMDSNHAKKEGHDLKVEKPFIMQGDTAYMPVSAIKDLFEGDMSSFEIGEKEVTVHPSPVNVPERVEGDTGRATSPELDFADDPQDPFKGSKGEGVANEAAAWSPADSAIPVLKNINMDTIIQKGKQYLGVRYLFGADPYPQSGRFDCSTFTQYLFGKQGVELPRLAREQGELGTSVSRKNLRKGDLMFFYVPGRFRSNRTVGHVGIYMGNSQMLHSSPEPEDGVQVTNINKPYWKETFLFAKRVAY